MTDVTKILTKLESGDESAAEKLLPLVYAELRKLAAAKLANEKPGQTIQATELVHDAWIRLLGPDDGNIRWNGRGHFFGAAAKAMQRILVEHARRKKSLKVGGNYQRKDLSVALREAPKRTFDILELTDVLEKLESKHPRMAELVRLRFFAGLTHEESARALGISTSTADEDWSFAKAWLRVELEGWHAE
ncbi:MAG: ECF-type sigma factor [Planctomycetota bacterium]